MHAPSWFAARNRTVSSTLSREPPPRHRGLAMIGPLTLATGSSPTAHSTRLSNAVGSYTLRGWNGAPTLMGSLTTTPSIELVMISPEIPIVRSLFLSLYPLAPRWLLGTLQSETHTVLFDRSWASSQATDPPPFLFLFLREGRLNDSLFFSVPHNGVLKEGGPGSILILSSTGTSTLLSSPELRCSLAAQTDNSVS